MVKTIKKKTILWSRPGSGQIFLPHQRCKQEKPAKIGARRSKDCSFVRTFEFRSGAALPAATVAHHHPPPNLLPFMKPFIIGITGGSGSGKTSFIKELASQFSGEQICIISQDDYYRPRESQEKDDQGFYNFDLPKAIDKRAFLRDLEKIMGGECVTRPAYVFNNETPLPPAITYVPAPVIIVEGLFVMHFKKIKKLLDLKIFVSAKDNIKVIRRIRRDQVERNYPVEVVLYRYENHVLPAFEKFVEPYLQEADIVVNNNRSFNMGLQVVCGFLHHHLGARLSQAK